MERANKEELRASDYEYALLLAENSPDYGPEYWMVQIQAARIQYREQIDLINSFITEIIQFFEDMGNAMNTISEAFSDLREAMEAAPMAKLCPRHNQAMTTGGYCKLCISHL